MMFNFKLKRRIWNEIVSKTRNKKYYYHIYKSYWHYRVNRMNNKKSSLPIYYSARPNPGAGIGHQIANWIAGYWFAQQFGLIFVHIPFSDRSWDDFLGFGEGELLVDDLLLNNGYKQIRLPLFDENNPKEFEFIREIIKSYRDRKVVFIAEQDQYYGEQFGVMSYIRQKFHQAKARQEDKLVYLAENFNIAIHVRRGDISNGQVNGNENLTMRWQDNNYFVNVLNQVLQYKFSDKPVFIYLFSQGVESDLPEFQSYTNLHFCLDMDAKQSFLHMAMADLLITSKSSFSYKPALLSRGIKVCPKNFWHGYPDGDDWIMAENDGTFDVSLLNRLSDKKHI